MNQNDTTGVFAYLILCTFLCTNNFYFSLNLSSSRDFLYLNKSSLVVLQPFLFLALCSFFVTVFLLQNRLIIVILQQFLQICVFALPLNLLCPAFFWSDYCEVYCFFYLHSACKIKFPEKRSRKCVFCNLWCFGI